jgi:hypothetical protein
MTTFTLYNKSEKFKQGCIAGFYDARSDDGLRYLDDILRYGVRDDEDRAAFLAGYRAGQRTRRGGVLSQYVSSTSPALPPEIHKAA